MLLVDAFQGVEAQTVANAYAAMEHDLTIVPVINKIDLVHARVDEVREEMEHTLAVDAGRGARLQRQDGHRLRGRAGGGDRARAAADRRSQGARCRRWCSTRIYDEYRGAVTYVRVMNGTVRKGQKIKFLQAGTTHEVVELGQFAPQRKAAATSSRRARSATSSATSSRSATSTSATR